jgi:hypothetical protein
MLAVAGLPLIGMACLRAPTLRVSIECREEDLDVGRRTPLVQQEELQGNSFDLGQEQC